MPICSLRASGSTDGGEGSCKQMSCLHLLILLRSIWMALLVQGRQGRVLRCLYQKGQEQGRQTELSTTAEKAIFTSKESSVSVYSMVLCLWASCKPLIETVAARK